MLKSMIAALLFTAICLQSSHASICLEENVLSMVGDQLLEHTVADSMEREQAAFLTRNDDGSMGCRLWPLTTENKASTYRGIIPSAAVAIIHTHPHEWI